MVKIIIEPIVSLFNNVKDKFQAGFISTRNNYNMQDDYFDVDQQSWYSVLNSEGYSYMVLAFGGWKHQFGQRLSVVTGIHTTYFHFNGNFSIDPRLAWSYELNKKQKLGFAIGVHSKLESMSIYQRIAEAGNGNYYEPNKDLDFTKSIHFVASHDRYFSKNLHFKGKVYYQYLYDVPVGLEENNSYSMLNSTAGYVDFALQNDGFGRNYGLDLTFERYFDNDYYFLISGSVFNSEFKNPELAWRKGRFAGDYLFNALDGKDFKIAKSKPGNRTLTLSLKATVLGGKRDYPILIEESIAEETTVYDRSDPWGIMANDIFFINLAATYRIDKAKVSHEVKLDIQNVTNNQAAIGKYYDPTEGGIVSYYQLAMFPVLSYKIYF